MKFFHRKKNELNLLCGDFNVAPYEDDVWSHKQLRNVVSHTNIERKKLLEILNKGNLVDAVRIFNNPQKIFLLGGATGQKILTKTTEAEDLIIFG